MLFQTLTCLKGTWVIKYVFTYMLPWIKFTCIMLPYCFYASEYAFQKLIPCLSCFALLLNWYIYLCTCIGIHVQPCCWVTVIMLAWELHAFLIACSKTIYLHIYLYVYIFVWVQVEKREQKSYRAGISYMLCTLFWVVHP